MRLAVATAVGVVCLYQLRRALIDTKQKDLAHYLGDGLESSESPGFKR
jgi:hypothetical protein